MKKRSGMKKVISICIMTVFLMSVFSFAGCYFQKTGSKEERPKENTQNTERENETDISGGLPLGEGTVSGGGESAEEPKDAEISLIMVGDMLMHMGVIKSGYFEEGLNYDHLFTNIKDLVEEADIAIVNQETILGGEGLGYSGYPRFNSPYEVGDAIADAGFNVVLHATNHTLDKGEEGITNCLAYWRESHPDMAVLGMQDSQEQRESVYVYEKDGVKIAVLNYTYGTNGLPLPKDMPYAVSLLDKEAVKQDIERAGALSDFIVVCPHWGTEYVHTASSYQKDWADFFLENGVDLVIGTHPHVIEPVEWLEREDGHKMLVYYSLGNFVNATNSEQRGVADRMVGAMAKVVITKEALSGETYISQYGVEPMINHYQYGEGLMSSYPLSRYTDELAKQSEAVKKDSVFSLQFCYDLCTEVFGEELMDGMITVEKRH